MWLHGVILDVQTVVVVSTYRQSLWLMLMLFAPSERWLEGWWLNALASIYVSRSDALGTPRPALSSFLPPSRRSNSTSRLFASSRKAREKERARESRAQTSLDALARRGNVPHPDMNPSDPFLHRGAGRPLLVMQRNTVRFTRSEMRKNNP